MKPFLRYIKSFVLSFLLMIFSITTYAQVNQQNELRDASKLAVQWLNYVNSNSFIEAWNGLSIDAQKYLGKDDWIIAMSREMENMGDFISRKETYREFNSQMDGMPDGYYAIFEYSSNYKSTEDHTEALLLHQDDKRKWRVIGFQYDYKGGKDAPEN